MTVFWLPKPVREKHKQRRFRRPRLIYQQYASGSGNERRQIIPIPHKTINPTKPSPDIQTKRASPANHGWEQQPLGARSLA